VQSGLGFAPIDLIDLIDLMTGGWHATNQINRALMAGAGHTGALSQDSTARTILPMLIAAKGSNFSIARASASGAFVMDARVRQEITNTSLM
jgi:hypothetical protein